MKVLLSAEKANKESCGKTKAKICQEIVEYLKNNGIT